MATTTSNFSWPIPQSTDLVKDGATAIASLGSGIDTSMAELKGGTTGQILSKTSGTDMDFTWITPNPGDITGVTAGTGITGGGTSGDVTVSFDVANYGGGQKAAGKNAIINGGFDIWQRGTTFSTNGAYCADRWKAAVDAGTFSITRSTDAPTGFTYSLSFAGTSTTSPQIYTLIESTNSIVYAGQTVTLSIYAKSTVGSSGLGFYTYYPGATDDWTSATADANGTFSASPSGSWTRYSATFTVNALASRGYKILIYRTSSAASSTTLYAGVQLELGSTATPFSRTGGTIQGELAACQRYYVRWGGSNVYERIALGIGASATVAKMVVNQPVAMRVAPTSIDYSNISVYDTATITACSSVTINAAGTLTTELQANVASGLTAFRPYQLMTNGSTGYYLGLSAEL